MKIICIDRLAGGETKVYGGLKFTVQAGQILDVTDEVAATMISSGGWAAVDEAPAPASAPKPKPALEPEPEPAPGPEPESASEPAPEPAEEPKPRRRRKSSKTSEESD